MKEINWADRQGNEAVLRTVGEERRILKFIGTRKRNWSSNWTERERMLMSTTEVNETKRGGRRIVDSVKILAL